MVCHIFCDDNLSKEHSQLAEYSQTSQIKSRFASTVVIFSVTYYYLLTYQHDGFEPAMCLTESRPSAGTIFIPRNNQNVTENCPLSCRIPVFQTMFRPAFFSQKLRKAVWGSLAVRRAFHTVDESHSHFGNIPKIQLKVGRRPWWKDYRPFDYSYSEFTDKLEADHREKKVSSEFFC